MGGPGRCQVACDASAKEQPTSLGEGSVGVAAGGPAGQWLRDNLIKPASTGETLAGYLAAHLTM